jgi:hypothetical protein
LDKSALIIRNVSSLTPSEIGSIITLCQFKKPLVIDASSPAQVQSFQTKINNGTAISAGDFANQQVRDYLFATAKANTGNHLILHLDHTAEDAQTYIMGKLNTLKDNEHISVFYLGGGHGGGHGGSVDDETSGLQKSTINAIVAKLESKNLSVGAEVFGSCYSAAFANDFRDFLIDDGVMLSDSVECGHNGFDNLVRWMIEPGNKPFYSDEEISATKIKVSDMRTKFNETVGDNAEIAKKHLVLAYADYMKTDPTTLTYAGVKLLLNADATLNGKVMDHKTDMFDAQIADCSADIHALGANPTTLQLQTAVNKYPLLKDYVDNLQVACVYADYALAFKNKMVLEIAQFEQTNTPGPDDDVSDDLMAYLRTKFTTPREGNYLRIFEHLKDIELPSNMKEYKDFATDKLQTYLAEQYDPSNRHGPQIKVFKNADALFQSIAVGMQKEMVTSKVLSTNDDSQLTELSASTGKPSHTCEDAFTRVKKVIDILSSDPAVKVIAEKSVTTFNQASIMTEFNESFSIAMEESARLHKESRRGHDDIVVDPRVAAEHLHALKDQLGKMKADAAPKPPQVTANDGDKPIPPTL